MPDRHARSRRADVDRRRRPTDGFRTRSVRRFDRLIDDAIASLPAELLSYLDNVQVSSQEVPPPVPAGGAEVLLGSYQAAVRVERVPGLPDPPDRLILFRRPLEARAHNRSELTALVRDTVVHEIANHLGIDDDRLDELGWG